MTYNPPRFDTIDWVSLARSLGIYIGKPDGPVILQLITNTERDAYAYHYFKEIQGSTKITVNYVRDILQDKVFRGEITSLDKAIIVRKVRMLISNQ